MGLNSMLEKGVVVSLVGLVVMLIFFTWFTAQHVGFTSAAIFPYVSIALMLLFVLLTWFLPSFGYIFSYVTLIIATLFFFILASYVFAGASGGEFRWKLLMVWLASLVVLIGGIMSLTEPRLM